RLSHRRPWYGARGSLRGLVCCEFRAARKRGDSFCRHGRPQLRTGRIPESTQFDCAIQIQGICLKLTGAQARPGGRPRAGSGASRLEIADRVVTQSRFSVEETQHRPRGPHASSSPGLASTPAQLLLWRTRGPYTHSTSEWMPAGPPGPGRRVRGPSCGRGCRRPEAPTAANAAATSSSLAPARASITRLSASCTSVSGPAGRRRRVLDRQRQQLLAGGADLDGRVHLRADAAVEAGAPAAVLDLGLVEGVLPVLPEPVLVEAGVEVVPGEHLLIGALAGGVPVDVHAVGGERLLRALHPAVVGEVLAPAVEAAAVLVDRADDGTDAAVAPGEQALDDAGLAVVVAEADGAAVLLVAADLVAELGQPGVGLLGGELGRPLEGGVRLGDEAADGDRAADVVGAGDLTALLDHA